MINACLTYLEQKLKPVMGQDSPYFTRMVDLKNHAGSHVCSAIPDSDTLVYSGAKSRNLDTGLDDRKLFDRTITVGVVLGEYKLEALDPLFEAFLASLDEGFRYAGHYVGITLGEAGWMDEKDSLIKAKMSVEIPIVFSGGIYRPQQFGKIETINIERES